MKTVNWLAHVSVALVVVVLIAACGSWPGTSSATTTPAMSSGSGPSPAGGPPRVIGSVTAGPVCPVEQSPPDPQCAPRLVRGAVIIATNTAGQEVGRATSAADGSYELVPGETGTLRVTGLPVEGLMGEPQPVEVTLTSPSAVERVDLEYDTGIR